MSLRIRYLIPLNDLFRNCIDIRKALDIGVIVSVKRGYAQIRSGGFIKSLIRLMISIHDVGYPWIANTLP
jgi:hypothetical protein